MYTMQDIADDLGVSKSTVSRMVNKITDFSTKYCVHTGYRLMIKPAGRQRLIEHYNASSHRASDSTSAEKGGRTKSKLQLHALREQLVYAEKRVRSQTKVITMLNQNLAKAQNNMALAQKLQLESHAMSAQRQKQINELNRKLGMLPDAKKPKKKLNLFQRIFRHS